MSPGCGGRGDGNKKPSASGAREGGSTGTVLGNSLPGERETLRVRELSQPGRLVGEAICHLRYAHLCLELAPKSGQGLIGSLLMNEHIQAGKRNFLSVVIPFACVANIAHGAAITGEFGA